LDFKRRDLKKYGKKIRKRKYGGKVRKNVREKKYGKKIEGTSHVTPEQDLFRSVLVLVHVVISQFMFLAE
jgi:hypothetical protein